MKILEGLDLQGKVIVLLNSPCDISRPLVVKANRLGARVAIIYKDTLVDSELDVVIEMVEDLHEQDIDLLPLTCNTRDPVDVDSALAEVIAHYGGIDIVVPFLGSIALVETSDTPEKDFQTMTTIDTISTRNIVRGAVPYLIQSSNPHVVVGAPPQRFCDDWNMTNAPYSMSRFKMSMCVQGLMGELANTPIAVNAVWPRVMIHLQAFQQAEGFERWEDFTRSPDVVVDAILWLTSQPAKEFTDRFFYDEVLLRKAGVVDFRSYRHKRPKPTRNLSSSSLKALLFSRPWFKIPAGNGSSR
ncbi:hypothetical protein IWQ62_005931 [Dispira parvispora]|uniref:Short chain dehydrogenase n=1 Tax=Dispira parvispora TaxID=1520584 RepID=A0A9W8AIS5_9FUNG|nr:hypothetical protein IWQ62_005931 [Dispira parvispora]